MLKFLQKLFTHIFKPKPKSTTRAKRRASGFDTKSVNSIIVAEQEKILKEKGIFKQMVRHAKEKNRTEVHD